MRMRQMDTLETPLFKEALYWHLRWYTHIFQYNVLFITRYESSFMLSLSDHNQEDVVEAFNSTSKYQDDLLNIDNPYFEQ